MMSKETIQYIITSQLGQMENASCLMRQELELIGLINSCLNTINRMNRTIERIENQQDNNF